MRPSLLLSSTSRRSMIGLLRRTFTGERRLPLNTAILFVPQQEAWIVQRFGKYSRTLDPGFNFLIPIIDRVAYVQSLKEIAIDIPEQAAITLDNVVLQLNGVLYLKVMDPYKASYGVEDAEYAITQLAQTTMRSELGKISLDSVFKEREVLNNNIVTAINVAAEPWGIDCLRYEIRDIDLPEAIRVAMQLQVEAERKKRATVLDSEGKREADINVAEGKKRARILASEAQRTERVNQASGEAEAVRRVAEAKARALEVVAEAIAVERGSEAVSMAVAQQYIEAFEKLAKETNTVLLPAQTGDLSSMVAQAMTIYKSVNAANSPSPSRGAPRKDGGAPERSPLLDAAGEPAADSGEVDWGKDAKTPFRG